MELRHDRYLCSMRHTVLTGILACLLLQFAHAQTRIYRPLQEDEGGQATLAAKVSSHNDRPQLYTTFSWMDSLSAWDTLSQTTLSYDANGYLSEEITQNYIGNAWVPSNRALYVFDSNGRSLDERYFVWNGSSWDSTIRYVSAYDALGRPNLFLIIQWNGSAWDTISGTQSVYTYRNVDQVESRVKWRWRPLQSIFTLEDSTWYSYDAADEWDTVTTYSYAGPGWTASNRTVGYTWYDFSKRLPLTGRYQTYATSWTDYTRYRATYGANDSQTWVYHTYNAPNWDSTGKEVFVYDAQEHLLDYQYYDWIGAWEQSDGQLNQYAYNGIGQTLERIQQLFDGYLYRFERRMVYANFLVATATPTLPAIKVVAFPNPVSDQLRFSVVQSKPGPVSIQLYDLQGRLRAETLVQLADGIIDLAIPAQLPSGSYSYRLTTREGSATGKVMVYQ
jgi:hypothetical protein